MKNPDMSDAAVCVGFPRHAVSIRHCLKHANVVIGAGFNGASVGMPGRLLVDAACRRQKK